jgi:hypothetical protein
MLEVTHILASSITYPSCGHRATETMPIDACQFFYDCKGRSPPEAQAGGLLRILFLRHGAMPTDASGERRGSMLPR